MGVEITSERINIVQLRRQNQGLKLVNMVSAPVPEGVVEEGRITDPLTLAELLRTTLAEHKITTKRVATAVPVSVAVNRLIKLPAELDDAELREMVLNQEAALYLPFPREEADVDYQKLGITRDEDGIDRVEVMLVATSRETTESYLDTFRQAELQVDVIEVSSFALIRTVREKLRQFSPQEAVAIVDIEFDNTEISIVIDGVPQFSRTVPIGTFQIQSALARAMNIPPTRSTDMLQNMTVPLSPADGGGMMGAAAKGGNPGMAAILRILGDLADELRRSIDFYLTQGENLEIAQLLLAGPGGGLGQLDEFFSQRLSLPTEQIDPVSTLSLLSPEEILPSRRPGLGVVLGLGLREL
ncbi:type IV pilus assembly protein PilM [Leptolyngbya sp. FACHB-261]|uniref:type IV pilus assembly protein PilM n=1 Tax=Leptolyngbya sp. FACHB-261 TaxID=2692806 RepID=UPI0018EFB8D2|nr:type IV pilus assembly protein PilM [Leptolyngbya sp. FACHB-261]